MPTKSRPTVVDLFCGAGGASYGFKKLGFEMVLGLDIRPDAVRTFAYNMRPREVIVDDIKNHDGKELLKVVGDCDVLIGCPPCQGFTRLNRKGPNDPRNDLVYLFGKISMTIAPKVLVFENVYGVLLARNRVYFEGFLDLLRKNGYSYMWDVLDMADYGVPQRRRRLILVAVKDGSKVEPLLPPKTHARPDEAGRLGLKPWRTVRDAIGDLPPLEPGEADPKDPLHAARRHGAKTLEIIRNIPKNGGSRKDLPPELVLRCHAKHDGHYDVYGRMRWDAPAPTLTSGCTNPSRGRFIHPEQDRGITLREAARLQTFPDDYVFFGARTSVEYQIGNAVPPLFSERLAETVKRLLNSI